MGGKKVRDEKEDMGLCRKMEMKEEKDDVVLKKEKEIKQLQKENKEKNETIGSLNKKTMKKKTVIIDDNLLIRNCKLEGEINNLKEEEVEIQKRS